MKKQIAGLIKERLVSEMEYGINELGTDDIKEWQIDIEENFEKFAPKDLKDDKYTEWAAAYAGYAHKIYKNKAAELKSEIKRILEEAI